MTQKEKLEEAKRLYQTANADQKYVLESLFPELKESEDEKIRKELLSVVNDLVLPDEQHSRFVAWLEKQGEHKSADKVEPKFKVKYAGSEYNVLEVKDIAGVTYYGIEDEPDHIDYVQAENCERVGGYGIKENGSPFPTKPAVFSEQKPAWSEEKPTQEIEPFEAEHGKYYYCIKDYFCGGRKQASKGDVVQALRGLPIMGLKDASEYFLPVNFIKCNSTWTEKDEKHLSWLIEHLGQSAGLYDNLIDWLKSLKERYTWKPSDEQIKALHNLNLTGNISYAGQGQVLIELQEQLKKLKGE